MSSGRIGKVTTLLKSFNAFTLAEVLITLGIIGVVASLTMPVLINNTQNKILETQLAKSKNIITNGYKLMLAKTETFNITNLPFLNSCSLMSDLYCLSREHKSVFKIITDNASGMSSASMPQEYSLPDAEEKSPFQWYDVPYIFTTSDGMVYGIDAPDGNSSFDVYIDINGTKKPNTVKKDLFKFRVSGNVLIADTSNELEGFDKCTPENLDKCDSLAACNSLSSRFENESGACPGVWYDNHNGCNIWGWTQWECRE